MMCMIERFQILFPEDDILTENGKAWARSSRKGITKRTVFVLVQIGEKLLIPFLGVFKVLFGLLGEPCYDFGFVEYIVIVFVNPCKQNPISCQLDMPTATRLPLEYAFDHVLCFFKVNMVGIVVVAQKDFLVNVLFQIPIDFNERVDIDVSRRQGLQRCTFAQKQKSEGKHQTQKKSHLKDTRFTI